jgi:hypothetical protein
VLLVKRATDETDVEKSCKVPRAQLLVLLVKRATLDTDVDQFC